MMRPSKLQRTESTSLSAQVAATELDHPRKEATQQSSVEEKDHPTSSGEETKKKKHPTGRKVKATTDVESLLHKTKYLPLSDSINIWDVWFKPLVLRSNEKGFLEVEMEELYDGVEHHVSTHVYTVFADDFLKMLYLADMVQNSYFTMQRISYENWFAEKASELVKSKEITSIGDHGTIATLLFNKDSFNVCKGTGMEIYFQKKAVHEFSDAVNHFENPNLILCKSVKASFEYVIESRVFILDSNIHPVSLGEIIGESLDPLV